MGEEGVEIFAALFVFDQIDLGEIDAEKLAMEFAGAEGVSIVFHMELGHFDEGGAAELGAVVDDEIFDGDDGVEEADVDVADFDFEAGFVGELVLDKFAGEGVEEQEDRRQRGR